MINLRFIFACVAVVILVCSASIASARPATTYVNISDQAYRDIEKLTAFGLCYPPMFDQRPFTRGEFARLVAQALDNWAQKKEIKEIDFEHFGRLISQRRFIDRMLQRLTQEFHDELVDTGAIEGERASIRGHPFNELRLDAIFASSAPLTIIPNNGLGDINAVVNPLLDYRDGRHAIDGFQTSFEFDNRFTFGRHFAIAFTPRAEADSWENGNSLIMPYLQDGYGVVQFGDAALTFGRKNIVWGPGERGSLLFSTNPRPLDLIEFSTPSPFKLPWVFKYLGQWRISMFGANLGPEYSQPYAWLGAWRASLMPMRYLELSFGHVVQMGGQGAPPLSATDVIGEFFGFRPGGSDPDSINKSNHQMEASLVIRIPQLWGISFYGAINNEDKRDSIKRFLRDGSSYLAGVYMPRLMSTGKSDLRIEFRRMCALAYRHSLYSDGYTLNRLIIGDDLGPDALGLHMAFNHEFSNAFKISSSFDWELRRSDIHGITTDPDGTQGDIVVTAQGPHEQRYRAVLIPSIKLKKNLKFDLGLGYERVLNAGYVQSLSRNNWLLALTLKIDLDSHFRFEVH